MLAVTDSYVHVNNRPQERAVRTVFTALGDVVKTIASPAKESDENLFLDDLTAKQLVEAAAAARAAAHEDEDLKEILAIAEEAAILTSKTTIHPMSTEKSSNFDQKATDAGTGV